MGSFSVRPSVVCLSYLDPIWPQPWRRALLEVCGEVLVDVLEHEVQGHLPLAAGAVADVKQSVERKGNHEML